MKLLSYHTIIHKVRTGYLRSCRIGSVNSRVSGYSELHPKFHSKQSQVGLHVRLHVGIVELKPASCLEPQFPFVHSHCACSTQDRSLRQAGPSNVGGRGGAKPRVELGRECGCYPRGINGVV